MGPSRRKSPVPRRRRRTARERRNSAETVKPRETSRDLLGRALAHRRAGRNQEAESLLRKVISRNAENDQALFALAALLFESRRFEEAGRYLERLVAMYPREPVFLTNLGEAYRRQGALERAAEVFERILDDDPDFPEARQNLGITLMESGAPAGALPHLERAVALRPDSVGFRVSLAWALLKLGRVEASLEHARRAVELDPNHAPAHHHLANALVELGERAAAIASYRRAVELDPSDADAHSNLILVALTDPGYDARAILAESRAWAKLHAEPLRVHERPHVNVRDPERPLRVGYVSPDLRAHPVRHFLRPLLLHHDRSAYEYHLYSSVERPDAATDEFRDLAGERFHDIRRLDDLAAAELVRRDRIDVLVDLALHGAGNRLRLFACKPAPVQVTWLGYTGTTGLDSIDYRISDPFFDPPEADLGVYSETTLRLPESSWCYDALEPGLEVGPLPALATGVVTFGGMNSTRKLHEGVLELWARVLGEVPDAKLFLYAEEHAWARVQRSLERAGISPQRVELGGRVSRRDYLERYHRIDVALDTFPFAGGTTSLDAVWMGVPVVTLAGDTCLARAGSCIAANLGLPELVARTPEEFVARAAALASDLPRLSSLRTELRGRLAASAFGDAPRFARNLEAAYRTAWRRYCAGS
jgi:predicted O-linked N-acetylglucosamine transferase (SPINDLY family)